MIQIGTQMFYWNSNSKEFIQEISTLRVDVSELSKGFSLKSHKTGAVVQMKFVSTEFSEDEDHEVVAWRFVSTGPVAFGLIVIND